MATKSRLLLFSNSTLSGEPFLGWTLPHIREFLGELSGSIVFIPFAGVSIDWDEYGEKVRSVLSEVNFEMIAIHTVDNPVQAIQDAAVIMIGGGNTFHLVYHLQKKQLIKVIKDRVHQNIPYIGWSAGANVACPTLRTTNDMPIIEPDSFETLDLVPFQINPHYTSGKPANHAGESRDDRILEFKKIHPEIPTIGLPEGMGLHVTDEQYTLFGTGEAFLFSGNRQKYSVIPGNITSQILL